MWRKGDRRRNGDYGTEASPPGRFVDNDQSTAAADDRTTVGRRCAHAPDNNPTSVDVRWSKSSNCDGSRTTRDCARGDSDFDNKSCATVWAVAVELPCERRLLGNARGRAVAVELPYERRLFGEAAG